MTKNISLIIMSAGESTRFRQNCHIKKQWIRICNKPLWLFVADNLNGRYKFSKTIIAAHKSEVAYMRRFCNYEIVCGGESRQKSLENALNCVNSEFVAVSDAARFGVDFAVLDRLFAVDLSELDCVIPVLDVADTIFMEGDSKGNLKYLNRNSVKLAQTPQISRVSVLREALKLGDFSDESSAVNALGGKIHTIKGSKKLDKLTHFEDFNRIWHLQSEFDSNISHFAINPTNRTDSTQNFIGYGFDTHRFCKGDEIVLCGVKIPCEFGIEAHSDGDVALHALMDAILGAVGAGDIGEWFPPNDERFKNADSLQLLNQIVDFVRSVGFEMVNVDMMIITEVPKITPHKDKMLEILSNSLHLPKNRVNIKATTMEQMGFIGRKDGICAKAVVSLIS